ncbi:class I SAM-dependent methyltransferase [Pseudarthrobacter sulfonivorans]|uniref:class I SAM-dependent methyltransferase n=1 Tax=Pseudarthrobacter sulfonivorans TaxID=121292 RepID=UPI002782D08D|nr:class I SAM-dependent methyltransferase [Pseudarthrobacter sulfonivorans]MDP9996814.1 16S rRNA (guanine1207-N2)-methyltransferase [Pseudarthrobacter sulfonivorans]
MAENSLEDIFGMLRRYPDVEAPNLQAWDATDRLLLEAAAGRVGPDSSLAVIGDRYGALTLGALGALGVRRVRVHEDLITGERALQNNAGALGLAGFEQLPLGAELLAGGQTVLLQLPRTLAELEEIAAAVARHAAPDVVLLAGGRIKHMSLGMNAVLERHFQDVRPQLARQKSRLLVAAGAVREGSPGHPAVGHSTLEHIAELDLDVEAHGAVFAGAKLDIGTRFLLTFLPEMPAARHAIDLGCGSGILAAMYARQNPGARVTATDRSAAAVASALGTARANGLAERITTLQDDAMSTLPDASADLVLLNPPFHLGASVHAGAGIKLFEAAARVLAPGGELWTVFNRHLQYLPALERLVGPTTVKGSNPKFTVAVSARRP